LNPTAAVIKNNLTEAVNRWYDYVTVLHFLYWLVWVFTGLILA